MNQKDKYERNTSTLRELFKKADNSGKIAWDIGDLLLVNYENRFYLNEYKNFEDYTEKEFGKTGQTARTYISIRKRFEWGDISENMLVTHLKAIADFEDSYVGNIVLKALKTVATEEDGKDPKISKTIPSTKDIDLSLKLLSKANRLDEKQAVQTLKAVAEESKKSTSKKKKKKSKEEKFGEKLVSDGIPEIANLFENEPIDEMGTVALFCILFPFIKGLEFKLGVEKLSFESFQYVRAPFPDSSIRVKELKARNQRFKYLKIEFEFESYNFIKHKHFEDSKFEECKLIVCWKDNIVGNKVIPIGLKERLPAIIEISDILKSGKINVKNIIQEEKKKPATNNG